MNKNNTLLIIVIFLWSTLSGLAQVSQEKGSIFQIDITKPIDKTSQIMLSEGLKEAAKINADIVLLRLNTYGGMVESADSMRTAILYNKIPVYVFIDNNAASAGALISIACKRIYMRPGANIGAASVVNQNGEIMPDKYQSYMRSLMRSTAEYHGKDTIIINGEKKYSWKRNPNIAEAMVDQTISIPNLIDSTKVLTFTATEAQNWHFCDGITNSIDELITKELGYKEYTLTQYKPAPKDLIKGFLMNPILQAILIMIIIGGIYFELQSPGIGFPLLASIIAALLYFTPLYIDGLAAHWEIFLFFIGIVLILIEVFVIPGFGITGVLGSIFVVIGLTLSLVGNINFDFDPVSSQSLLSASTTVIIGLIGSFGLMIWITHKIGSKGIFSRLALQKAVTGSINEQTQSTEKTNNDIALCITDLRPSGKIQLGGNIEQATSEDGEYISSGEKVKIIRNEAGTYYVRIIKE